MLVLLPGLFYLYTKYKGFFSSGRKGTRKQISKTVAIVTKLWHHHKEHGIQYKLGEGHSKTKKKHMKLFHTLFLVTCFQGLWVTTKTFYCGTERDVVSCIG